MDTNQPGLAAGNELRMTRRLPVPPEAVFRAWLEPDSMRGWWGPRDRQLTECEVEPRAGGRFVTRMRGADGEECGGAGVIEALEAPRRLVIRFDDMPGGAGGPLGGARLHLDLAPEGEGTRLDLRWTHPTAEMRAAHEAMGFERGWGAILDQLTAQVTRPAQMCPLATPPADGHGWLHRLLGEWDYTGEFVMPDGGTGTGMGTESVRSLGGYWVVGEAHGWMPGPGGFESRCIITLGFDAARGRFTGSWIGSMMPHMSHYDGALSEDGRVLTLESEGPDFTGEGTALYRDTLAWEDEDHRRLETHMRGPDGAWIRLMTLRHARRA